MVRQYSNTAANTTIMSAGFMEGSTQLVVASSFGYPVPSPENPFTLRINPGANNEEIVDVVGGMGTSSSPWIVQRGKDGTRAQEWKQGTAVVHGFSARDFREIQEVLANAQNLISNAFPVGGILLWYSGFSSVPKPKFAICDGRAWDMTTGGPAERGAANSITTPDLRSKFIYGASDLTGGKPPGVTGGSNTMTATTMPEHKHTISMVEHDHTIYNTDSQHKHQMRAKDGFLTTTTADKGYSLPVTYTNTSANTQFYDAFMSSAGDGKHNHDASAHKHDHGGFTGVIGNASVTENNMPAYVSMVYIMRVAY